MIEWLLGTVSANMGMKLPGVPSGSYREKGGGNVERMIKLVRALTALIRALADLIRNLKA